MGFFLLAGEPHDYRGETGDYTVDAFGFGGEAAGAVLKALRFQASGVYRFSDPDSFRRQVGAMAELPGEADPARRGSVMVYQLLLQLSRSIRSVPGPGSLGTRPRSGFIREMISYMEEHCEQPLSLDDMSDRFSRSKEYICAAFKKETGMTCVDFLTRVRVFRARGLLLDHPEMKLEQVAKACGFSSASYFGAVFKKDTGVTPGAFRLTAGY